MITVSPKKYQALTRLAADNGIIASLAIDQRGAMVRMFDELGVEPEHSKIENLKTIVSEELTQYSSSILLDPVYGYPAAKARDKDAGLLLAYEVTGYDKEVSGRLPRLIEDLSVVRLLEEGADGVKLLLYYDADESQEINDIKHAFIERVGSECHGEDIPFFLEILTYDANIEDEKSAEYAKVKPHKVIEAMKEFSKPNYKVDVLKMETPVNMMFVKGYTDGEIVHTKEVAATYFKEQSESTNLPFIFLSAGVSAELFQKTLVFANESGSEFNGVLCGRATWKGVVDPFAKDGEEAGREWLRTQGKENITTLNEVINRTAKPWYDRISEE